MNKKKKKNGKKTEQNKRGCSFVHNKLYHLKSPTNMKIQSQN
jgi:hypothetical protein